MYEKNGVAHFKPGETEPDHLAFQALAKVSLGDVRFPWGFFIVTEEGGSHVVPATEADHTALLAKIFPGETPIGLGRCGYLGGDCLGSCDAPYYVCAKLFIETNPGVRYQYACACVPMW